MFIFDVVCIFIFIYNEVEIIVDVILDYWDEGFVNVFVIDGGFIDGIWEFVEDVGVYVVV